MKKLTQYNSLALHTDLYQLMMARGYWENGLADREAAFHLTFRANPFQGGYAIAAGLKSVIELLQNFSFSKEDLNYLSSLTGEDGKRFFPDDFLTYLANLDWKLNIDAVAEGSLVFPQEPLLRITGPLLQCQLMETPLLNLVNFQTLVATKAARICFAAKGEPVLEFGLRRAQGIDGALAASRAAYIGGCTATSNLLAGKIYGIPVRGTHAHSWVMVFPDELTAFQAYAKIFPNNSVFLVDTFNSMNGIQHAIEIGKQLVANGHRFIGIRLDSGDLAYLSQEARKALDAAGFEDAIVAASNDLNEHIITSLKAQGAAINVWGVGTKLVTAYDQPALDGVYKLSALKDSHGEWQYKIKLSEQAVKISTPGLLRVKRFFVDQEAVADVIYDELIGWKESEMMIDPFDPTRQKRIPNEAVAQELLQPIFREGKLVYHSPSLHEIRVAAQKNLLDFHEGVKRLLNPHHYPVGLEKRLYDLKTKLTLEARAQE